MLRFLKLLLACFLALVLVLWILVSLALRDERSSAGSISAVEPRRATPAAGYEGVRDGAAALRESASEPAQPSSVGVLYELAATRLELELARASAALWAKPSADEASCAGVDLRQNAPPPEPQADMRLRDEEAEDLNVQIKLLTERGDLAERALKASEQLSAERERLYEIVRERNEALARELTAARQEAEAQRARADQVTADSARHQNAVADEQAGTVSLADTLAKVHAKIEALKSSLAHDAAQPASATKPPGFAADTRPAGQPAVASDRGDGRAQPSPSAAAEGTTRPAGDPIPAPLPARPGGQDPFLDQARRRAVLGAEPVETPMRALVSSAPADAQPAHTDITSSHGSAPSNDDHHAAQDGRGSGKAGDRLLSRAAELLGQGDIAGARRLLEYGVGVGSAEAAYALGRTYDPDALSAWRAVGVQGNPAKATELYQRALAGGFDPAQNRFGPN
jgi:hypothetical protein